MHLREIPLRITALVEEYNSDCTDERMIEIEAELSTLEDDFASLCQHLATLKSSYEGQCAVYSTEIERLTEKRFSDNRKAEWIEGYIKRCIELRGLEKLSTELYAFSFRKSSAVIVTSTDVLPEEFKRTKTEVVPDRKAIGVAFKSGQIVPGAYIEERKSLQIK